MSVNAPRTAPWGRRRREQKHRTVTTKGKLQEVNCAVFRLGHGEKMTTAISYYDQ